MRTTVTIDDDIIAELMKSEKTKNPAEAIRSAVQQHVRQSKVQRFLKIAGKKLLRDDYTNESLEAEQIRDAGKYGR